MNDWHFDEGRIILHLGNTVIVFTETAKNRNELQNSGACFIKIIQNWFNSLLG